MNSCVWKIGGEAGFGIMTTGKDFAKLAAKMGYHTADFADYPSLIRGGHNTYEVHLSSEKVRSSRRSLDILVCLNKATYELHKERLTQDSIVMYDSEAFEINDENESIQAVKIHLPLKNILKEHNASIVMMNTIALAASLALIDWPLEPLLELLERTFKKKGEEVVKANHELAQAGFDYVHKEYSEIVRSEFPQQESTDGQLVMSGNDAFSLGAVIADCRLYCAYPMTPASSVLTRLASWELNSNMVVRHAEDEISVVNEALGGSFGGVRSACGTSGGGFALMTESISFAGIAEIPLVIFLAQRAGPATGMPTWTEQGDLLFAIHAGHGEFPKIVLAPGDVEEMYEFTAKAFNLADVYQTPVIVLSDKHLSESHWTTPRSAMKVFADTFEVDRGKITHHTDEEKYLRYKDSEDGISPMLIPGQEGVYYQANSYEHIEDSHTSESAEARLQQVQKRARKNQTYLQNHFEGPKIYGELEKAERVYVCWGSTKMVVLDVVDELRRNGTEAAMIHFTHMYPMNPDVIAKLFAKKDTDGKKWILVENNSTGQLGKLLQMYAGVTFSESYLKYDGRQIMFEDLL